MTAVNFWSHKSSTQVAKRRDTRARRPSRASAGAASLLLFRTRRRTLHTDTFSTPTKDQLTSARCKYSVAARQDSLHLTRTTLSHPTLQVTLWSEPRTCVLCLPILKSVIIKAYSAQSPSKSHKSQLLPSLANSTPTNALSGCLMIG